MNLEARYGRVALNGAAASILLSLLALSALAWLRTADLTMGMMPMMTVDADTFVIFASTWAVMMAAMMFPSVAPVVLVYSQYARRVATSAWPVRTALFVGGYFLVWAAVGMIAYFVAIVAASLVETVPLLAEHPNVALGLAFIAGGLYQLSPLKDRCLGHCRSPLHWILRGFAPGAAGAIRMGITEGVFCLGCCLGLMVVLLAVGMSSLAWMGAIAAVIFVEKVIAPTPRVSRLVALGLLAIGVFIALAPNAAPAMSATLR